MDYFNDYFKEKTYTDDFGWNSIWNAEIDKWLFTLYEVDPTHYQNSRNKVIRAKQRDEFIAEIKALYYFREKLSLEIVSIEPLGKDNHSYDYSFNDVENVLWHTEVKHPSWQGEIWKDDSMTFEEKKERMSKPQFINAEGRSFSERDAIEDCIKNTMPKLKLNHNNLLVIEPNMFTPIGWIPYIESTVQEEVRSKDSQGLLNVVMILEIFLPAEKNIIEYKHKLIEINKTLHLT